MRKPCFYEKIYRRHHEGTSGMTRATIEIDYGYYRTNTIWIRDAPEWEGVEETRHAWYIGGTRNVTYRDVATVLRGTNRSLSLSTVSSAQVAPPEEEDILVFLDTFWGQFHPSLTRSVPAWTPTMSPFIRKAVRDTMKGRLPNSDDQQNNTSISQHYAAVHIRGSDGNFVGYIDRTISKVFWATAVEIDKWVENTAHDLPRTTRVSSSAIGLYVATDLKDLRNYPVFQSYAMNFTRDMYEKHQLKVTLFFQEDIFTVSNNSTTGTKEVVDQATKTATSVLGGMLYADLFWDIQVCVCATIGFSGSPGSTFSDMISAYRSGGDPC